MEIGKPAGRLVQTNARRSAKKQAKVQLLQAKIASAAHHAEKEGRRADKLNKIAPQHPKTKYADKGLNIGLD